MTSHGEALSLAAFWKDVPNADRHGREWLEGPQITVQDLRRGSARVERCAAAVWWAGFGAPGGATGSGSDDRATVHHQRPVAGLGAPTGQDRQNDRQITVPREVQVPRGQGVIRGRGTGKTSGQARSPKPLIFPFGNRHKGRLAIEVKEEDPRYWNWSITRADAASWWRPMVAKAGLLDDEDES